MIVELLGPPGAGKSALLPGATLAVARWAGREALTPDAAIERCLTHLPSARLIGPVFGRRARRLRLLLVDMPHGIAFVVSNPRLTALVVGAVMHAGVGWNHRRTLFARWIGVAARQRFLRRHMPGTAVVFDEGLYHRAINLFAWRAIRPSRGGPEAECLDVARYVELTPAPDLAIFVDADDALAQERLSRRGLPIRLRNRSPSEVAAFLRAATRIIRVVPAAAHDVRWVRVENASTVDAATDSIAQKLRALPERPSVQERRWPAEPVSRWRSVSRPDRWWSARPRSLGEAQLRELTGVAALFDMGAVRRARSVGSGRSWTVVVESAAGTFVVKRYKETVEEAAIHCEHHVLRRLAELDVPAPRLVMSRGGMTIVHGPAGRYAAYRHVAGYVSSHQIVGLPTEQRRRTYASGRVLGLLHDALAGTPPGDWPTTGIGSDGRRVDPSGPHAARLEAASELLAQDLGARVMALDARLRGASLATTTIHGDYGPYNLLVRPGCPLFVVDFELARLDWRLVDLVTALPRFAMSRAGFSADRCHAFLDGYLGVVPEMKLELALGPAVLEFLSLRRASVCIRRHDDGNGDPRWLREARARIRAARSLAAASHPVVAPLLARAS